MPQVGTRFHIRKEVVGKLPSRLAEFARETGTFKRVQTIGGTAYYVLSFGGAEGEFRPSELEPANALVSSQ